MNHLNLDVHDLSDRTKTTKKQPKQNKKQWVDKKRIDKKEDKKIELKLKCFYLYLEVRISYKSRLVMLLLENGGKQ